MMFSCVLCEANVCSEFVNDDVVVDEHVVDGKGASLDVAVYDDDDHDDAKGIAMLNVKKKEW